jgi:hypothetical protein
MAKGGERGERVSGEHEDEAGETDYFMEEPELHALWSKKPRQARARRLDLDVDDKPVLNIA